MGTTPTDHRPFRQMTLARIPVPAKLLATCVIGVMAIGMLGALGQIIVHDIIPTFYAQSSNDERLPPSADLHAGMDHPSPSVSASDRGDLLADLSIDLKKTDLRFYQEQQFVWILKWTHIHLFGMSMIFIFVGAITIFLDVGPTLRAWLVVLPFIGVMVDILSMWLKNYVSPAFFWLHLPGGGLFISVFAFVSLRALWEMWFNPI